MEMVTFPVLIPMSMVSEDLIVKSGLMHLKVKEWVSNSLHVWLYSALLWLLNPSDSR